MMSSKDHPPLIWDLPTRLCHWSLAVSVAVAWVSGEKKILSLHQWAGGLALSLALFRLMWGVAGGYYARFAQFITGPRPMLRHLRILLQPGKLLAEPGHNPIGGAMVIALLALIAIQATLGLFSDDDIVFVGPLGALISDDARRRLTGLHDLVGKLILLSVALHIAAILYYKLVKKRNLATAMITGRDRDLDPAHLPPEPRRAGSLPLAMALFAIASLAVAAVMLAAPKIIG